MYAIRSYYGADVRIADFYLAGITDDDGRFEVSGVPPLAVVAPGTTVPFSDSWLPLHSAGAQSGSRMPQLQSQPSPEPNLAGSHVRNNFV